MLRGRNDLFHLRIHPNSRCEQEVDKAGVEVHKHIYDADQAYDSIGMDLDTYASERHFRRGMNRLVSGVLFFRSFELVSWHGCDISASFRLCSAHMDARNDTMR
jgi:hypothetical protein